MAGDIEARSRFLRLFEAHGEQILLYFKRRTDPETARDGAADTFLVAWRRINDIPSGNELPWLYGVARRVLSQQRRAHGRRGRLNKKLVGLAPAEEPAPETLIIRNSEYTAVLEALERLRPQERELLQLAIWDELSHADIGVILGCSAHAVDQRLHRATKKLAREIDPLGHKPTRKAVPVPESGEEAS